MRTILLTPKTLAPLGEANNASTFLCVSREVLEKNRKPDYPYIVDLGVEAGPLLLLLGHSAELIFKSFLRSTGVKNSRLKNFKGFYYETEEDGNIRRTKKAEFRRHNLVFLFRVVRHICASHDLADELNSALKSHVFHREKHEVLLDEVDKPTFDDFCEQLRLLNASFDRPFRARYFQSGMITIPDCEVVLVALESLEKRLRREFFSNFRTN